MRQRLNAKDEVRDFRNALGQFPTGVAIVTASVDERQTMGMTINSFSSISLAPPLVSWSIDRGAESYQAFLDATGFNVTILAEDQAELAIRFATRGADKFRGIEFDDDKSPIIPGGCAWFKCDTYRRILLGDHAMLVGQVIEFARYPLMPLVFGGGQFQQLGRATEAPTRAAA